MKDFVGIEKTLGFDDPEEDPPMQNSFFLSQGIIPKVEFKPLVYPNQKNLHGKLRRKWLQRKEAAQRKVDANSEVGRV